jgi:hypothetical protein
MYFKFILIKMYQSFDVFSVSLVIWTILLALYAALKQKSTKNRNAYKFFHFILLSAEHLAN